MANNWDERLPEVVWSMRFHLYHCILVDFRSRLGRHAPIYFPGKKKGGCILDRSMQYLQIHPWSAKTQHLSVYLRFGKRWKVISGPCWASFSFGAVLRVCISDWSVFSMVALGIFQHLSSAWAAHVVTAVFPTALLNLFQQESHDWTWQRLINPWGENSE